MNKFLLSMVFIATTAMAGQQPTFNNKVGVSIRKLFQQDDQERVHAMIILKEKADLSKAELIEQREQRIQYVYDSLRNTAMSSQKNLIEVLEKQNIAYQQFYILNMVAVESITAEQVIEFSKRADVDRIIANEKIQMVGQPQLNPESRIRSKFKKLFPTVVEGNITSTGAPNIWSITQGQGIVVAGQDTGVQWDHPALKNSYRGNKNGSVNHAYSWHDSIKKAISPDTNPCGRNIEAPCDDNAHGTHTVGTMIGDDGAENKIGMAPKAEWIACRNMDNGVGRPTTYIECFEFFLAPYPQKGNPLKDGKPEYAPHVINNSWGCPPNEFCEGDELIPVLEAMYKAGIMVVVSAGNEGAECSTIQDPPAHHTDLTFSVGAHNHRNGGIASFSSRGPSKFDGGIGPDITAPGVSVRSAIPGSSYDGSFWSGTSMAGPHVAGLVALMWSANKSLIGKIDETMDLIRKTAKPQSSLQSCGGVEGTAHPNNVFGYGHINAEKAVKTAVELSK